MTAPIVLVALDRPEHSAALLPVAKSVAELERAALHIVYVAEQRLGPGEILERIGLAPESLQGTVIDPRIGDASGAILAAAAEANTRAIFLCTHHAAPSPGRPLGHTARAIVSSAPCPVVLVPPERGARPWSLRRLLLPHDGTPSTSNAIHPASRLAHRAGAEISVLNVAGAEQAAPAERGALTTPFYLDHPQHEWPAWATEFVERLDSICPLEGLRIRLALASGKPGDEILVYAQRQEIDLIVLAWRGELEADHATILKAVVGGARCPTMIVRV
jgi:nucleotide-binding universal stress UspA family protein